MAHFVGQLVVDHAKGLYLRVELGFGRLEEARKAFGAPRTCPTGLRNVEQSTSTQSSVNGEATATELVTHLRPDGLVRKTEERRACDETTARSRQSCTSDPKFDDRLARPPVLLAPAAFVEAERGIRTLAQRTC